MSDGPQIDIGAQNFARGIGGGPRSASKDKTNEETSLDNAAEAVAHQGVNVAELAGLDLQELGSAGIQRALGGDVEGFGSKMIMPSVLPDSQGGFIARLLHAIFIKNRDITDHTQGVGTDGIAGGEGFASGGIDAASGGGNDFFDSSGFSSAASNFSSFISDFMDFGSGNFSALGGLSSPAFIDAPIISSGRGGADLG